MGWTMLRERGGDMSEMSRLVKEAKRSLEEVCVMMEEMEEGGDSMGMRGGYGQRGNYGMRGGDSMGQRRGFRIIS